MIRGPYAKKTRRREGGSNQVKTNRTQMIEVQV